MMTTGGARRKCSPLLFRGDFFADSSPDSLDDLDDFVERANDVAWGASSADPCVLHSLDLRYPPVGSLDLEPKDAIANGCDDVWDAALRERPSLELHWVTVWLGTEPAKDRGLDRRFELTCHSHVA